MDVIYEYRGVHKPVEDGGYVGCKPAMPQSPGLYIIKNTNNPHRVYVGIAQSLQHRFRSRTDVYRQSNMTNGVLQYLWFFRFGLMVNRQYITVDDNGWVSPKGCGTFDAEHLLIRSVMKKGINVSNISKTSDFQFANSKISLQFTRKPAATHWSELEPLILGTTTIPCASNF